MNKNNNIKKKIIEFVIVFLFTFVMQLIVGKIFGFEPHQPRSSPLSWSEVFSELPHIIELSLIFSVIYVFFKNKIGNFPHLAL